MAIKQPKFDITDFALTSDRLLHFINHDSDFHRRFTIISTQLLHNDIQHQNFQWSWQISIPTSKCSGIHKTSTTTSANSTTSTTGKDTSSICQVYAYICNRCQIESGHFFQTTFHLRFFSCTDSSTGVAFPFVQKCTERKQTLCKGWKMNEKKKKRKKESRRGVKKYRVKKSFCFGICLHPCDDSKRNWYFRAMDWSIFQAGALQEDVMHSAFRSAWKLSLVVVLDSSKEVAVP